MMEDELKRADERVKNAEARVVVIEARERARLSYFISFSDAILLASLKLMSISSISTSLFIVFDSQCLQDFTMLSASFDMWASFITVVASFSTEMRDSSSRRRTLRF